MARNAGAVASSSPPPPRSGYQALGRYGVIGRDPIPPKGPHPISTPAPLREMGGLGVKCEAVGEMARAGLPRLYNGVPSPELHLRGGGGVLIPRPHWS